MDVNDYACILTKRVSFTTIASKLAPTECAWLYIRGRTGLLDSISSDTTVIDFLRY
jgi:hypothetical protein